MVVFYFTDFTGVTGSLLYKCYQDKLQLNRPHWLVGWRGKNWFWLLCIYITE